MIKKWKSGSGIIKTMFEILINHFLYIYFFTYFLNVNIGSALLNFHITKKIDLYKAILLGFATNLIIVSLFYLVLKASVQFIFIFLVSLSIIFLILNIIKNKKFYKIIFKPFIPILFFTIIFSYIAHKHGIQYYVFRGNYWDYFNYLASSLMIFNYSLDLLINNEILLQSQDIFPRMGWLFHLNIRPTINIYFSIFYNLKTEHFFLTNFIIKTTSFFFLFTTFYIFFYDLKLKFLKKKLTIFCLLLCLSFWPIYIFEIDSLVQLFSLSLLILCFHYLMNIEKIFASKNKLLISQFFIIHLALFLIYPEIFIIYSIASLIYLLLLGKRTVNLIKFNNYTFLALSILFIFSSSLFYKTHFVYLATAVEIGLNQTFEIAGYFGSFVLGKNNPVLNTIFVENLKNFLNHNQDFFSIGSYVHQGLISNGFNFYYLNILPSIFGFYQYTFNKISMDQELYHVLFLCLLNIGIIFFFLRNIKNIFNSSNNFTTLIKAALITFFLLSLLFIFKSAIWSIIKLYFFFSFFIMIISIFIFKKNDISLNYPFFILLIIFPLFFYTGVEHGIGRVNSFPSIINRQLKQNFSWKLNLKKIKECNSIIIKVNFKDDGIKSIKAKYLIIYMISNNMKYMLSNTFYPTNKNKKNYECQITLKDHGYHLQKL